MHAAYLLGLRHLTWPRRYYFCGYHRHAPRPSLLQGSSTLCTHFGNSNLGVAPVARKGALLGDEVRVSQQYGRVGDVGAADHRAVDQLDQQYLKV